MAVGGNPGMESVVVLINSLHRTLASHSPSKPSYDAWTKVFQSYQDQRLPHMCHIMEFSRLISRTQAWDNWIWKMLSVDLVLRSNQIVHHVVPAFSCTLEPFSNYSHRWAHGLPNQRRGSVSARELIRPAGCRSYIWLYCTS